MTQLIAHQPYYMKQSFLLKIGSVALIAGRAEAAVGSYSEVFAVTAESFQASSFP